MKKPRKMKWTDEAIKQGIRDMDADGVPINAETIKEIRPGLYAAIRRKGLGIQVAVEAAGVKYTSGRILSSKEFEERLRNPIAEPQRPSAILYQPYAQAFDLKRKGEGRVLNRIVSPLSMSESERIAQGG